LNIVFFINLQFSIFNPKIAGLPGEGDPAFFVSGAFGMFVTRQK
jgi:hypothetical protein